MTNNNYYQDPNMLTFKANAPLASFASLTFGSPSPTKEYNNDIIPQHPFNQDLTSLISYSNQPIASTSIISLTHDSFIKTTLHLLYRMPLFKDKICSKSYNPDDSKGKLLQELKSIFLAYDNSKEFKVNNLRHLLSRLFKAQNKFSSMQPDNPLDCYFIFINSLHNYSIQSYPNDICSQKCKGCFSHRNIFMDIQRRESCDCGWQYNEPLSYLNYIMNIPYERIIELGKNVHLVEMNKTSKFNSLNFFPSENMKENDNISSIPYYEKIKGKLFFYLSQLINGHNDKASLLSSSSSNVRRICKQCNKSYIKNTLFISNMPSYLSFSFSYVNMATLDLKNILSSLILIPKIFELGQLYDNGYKNKVFYEFFGMILLRKSMNYSVAIKNPDTTWEYRTEDNIITCQSWTEVIAICLKEICIPILMLFQIQEKYSNKEKDLDNDDIKILVKYISGIEEYRSDNIFRTNEGVIPINAFKNNNNQVNHKGSDKIASKCLIETLIGNPNNNSNINDININKSHENMINANNSIKLESFKGHTNINTATKENYSKNSRYSSNNHTNIMNDDILWYLCLNCGLKNRIENIQCLSCMKNNKDLISKLKLSKNDVHTHNHYESNFSNRDQSKQNCFNKPNSQFNNNSHITKAHQYKEQTLARINRQSSSKRELNAIAITQPKTKININNAMEYNAISRDISHENKEENNEKMIYHKQIKRLLANPEWKCDICGKYNKPSVYRCYSCKTLNPFQRDLLEGINIHKDHHHQSHSIQTTEMQSKRPQSQAKIKQLQNTYNTQSRANSKRNTFSQQTSSTRLKKRQLSVGSIKQKDFNTNIASSAISKQKANSIKHQRPFTSHCNMILHQTNQSHTKETHNKREPYQRPKTSQCKVKSNSLT